MEPDRFSIKLSALKDDELDGALREEVLLHLRNCEECNKRLAEFEQVDSWVKEMPGIEAGESFSLRILAGISRQHDLFDTAPSSTRFAIFLQLADSLFKLISGRHEYHSENLDEFSDFPPLSLSHAYFSIMALQE